jgi:hypothetical protein
MRGSEERCDEVTLGCERPGVAMRGSEDLPELALGRSDLEVVIFDVAGRDALAAGCSGLLRN